MINIWTLRTVDSTARRRRGGGKVKLAAGEGKVMA